MVKMGKMFGSRGLAVVCDGCGRKLWVGNVAHIHEGLDKAKDQGWKPRKGNDQCPDCR